MPGEKLRRFLEDNGVAYEVQEHELVYPAQEVAAAEHVPGRLVAKPVMLMADDRLVMVVVPASLEVDLDKARGALGATQVRLASEEEFADAFPDCELGAQPPFGNLYDVPVYVDEALASDPYIVFRDGSHTETMKIDTAEYLRLVQPSRVEVAAGS